MRVQELKRFNGVCRAQIAKVCRNTTTFYQIAVIDPNNRVVELAEFPVAWGIWTCREWLMSSDMKASGRTTRTYDATPPEGIARALEFYNELRSEPEHTARALWNGAYRAARRQK